MEKKPIEYYIAYPDSTRYEIIVKSTSDFIHLAVEDRHKKITEASFLVKYSDCFNPGF